MTTFAIAILVPVIVILLAYVLFRPIITQYTHDYYLRTKPVKEKIGSSAPEAPKDSQIILLCKTLGELVLSLLPALADKPSIENLIQANYRTPEHLAIFIGCKALCVIVVSGFMLLLAATNPGLIFVARISAPMAWIFPNFIRIGRVKQRKAQILRELSTIVDLLIVCAQAGLGLLMCIDKVSKEAGDSCPVLASEFQQFMNDVKIFAKATSNALQDMANRCGSDEMHGIVSSLIAAESKGSDISYPLRQQADALRDRLKRKKEEEAAKVPVKMVPVIVVFVLPLILVPLLGPAIVTIMQAMGSVNAK